MNKTHIKARLIWLSATLTAQRSILSTLLSRLRGFASSAETSPSLHPKFMRLLTHAAHHKNKEDDILDEIEAMEKRHQALKKRKGLRRASPSLFFDQKHREGRTSTPILLRHMSRSISPTEIETAPDAPAQSRSGTWKWLLLFCLLTPQERNTKRQDIRPN